MIIRNVRLIDPNTRFDGIADIHINGEVISEVRKHKDVEAGESAPFQNCAMSDSGSEQEQIIDADGLVAAPGLVDVHVHFRDPGQTYKEDIITGAKAAARGGYTTVVCMANTKPPVDNVETLEYVLNKAKETGIHVLQAAAVSKGLKGEELVDMETLSAHGAAGFTDDGIPLMDEGLVKMAMDEAARLNVPLSFHEEDPKFIMDNGINHGTVSERLGLFGSPALAEDSLVARDCMIALHTKAAINIQHISSAASVKMVGLARELGADIHAEATPHHFTLTEEAVLSHGTLAKMNPPLRTQADRQAVIKGLRDGVIDIIATDHAPHSRQEKEKPFPSAPSGIIGLETALGLAVKNLVRPGHLSLMELMEKMSLNPAKLYRLDCGRIEAGRVADLVLFDPNEEWTVERFESKSSNSPFLGETLIGKVKFTICKGAIVYQDVS